MSGEDVLIENNQLLGGAYLALDNARRFLRISKSLYEAKEFQAAIPLATISMEEALKAIELANRFRRGQNVSSEDWRGLTSHKHKLTHLKKDTISVLQKATSDEEAAIRDELNREGIDVPPISKNNLIQTMRGIGEIHSQFQELRESCFYSDWSDEKSKWAAFSEVGEKEQEDLAFFVLTEAGSQLDFLKFTIELMVSRARKEGQKLSDLPFPAYNEYRSPGQFESIQDMNTSRSKLDTVKHGRGLLVMKKLIAFRFKSLDLISLKVFSDTMLAYLKLIDKQDFNHWYPHPIAKALILALWAAREGDTDGNYAAVSGDAEGPEENPHMSFAAVVKKKGDQYELFEIRDLRNGQILKSDDIEKIIRTETVLERRPGYDAPVSAYVEALSIIGVKAKEIKRSELESATAYAKKVASNNQGNIPESISNEVKQMKGVGEWDDLMSETRSAIVTIFGAATYKEYTLFLSPTDDEIQKWKFRQSILGFIESDHLATT